MKYKYDHNIQGFLKYDMQEIAYCADRAVFAKDEWDKDYWFNEAIKRFERVMLEVQAFQQDQSIEQDADMADYIRRLEDEIPF